MKPLYSLLAVILMLVVAGIIVMRGEPDEKVGLSGVMELVGDAQRTAVKPAMMATRVTPAEEMELGRRLAGQMYFSHNTENADPAFKKAGQYVRQLGRSLLGSIARKEISYEFHLIDQGMVNAFALPGGQIFIFKGLLEFVESEAELAAIIGHEIAHVDARHCIELFQAEIATEKIVGPILGSSRMPLGIGMRLASRIIQGGYQQFQEYEADARGLRFAADAGYAPGEAELAMARLGMMYQDEKRPSKASDPVAELRVAIKTAAGSYFRSHPPTAERVERLRKLASGQFGHKKFYIGKENLKLRETRAQKEIAAEFTSK